MAKVEYKAKNMYTCSKVKLRPGINEVDDKMLADAMNNHLFMWRIDQGIIVIHKDDKEEKKQHQKQNLNQEKNCCADEDCCADEIELPAIKKRGRPKKSKPKGIFDVSNPI